MGNLKGHWAGCSLLSHCHTTCMTVTRRAQYRHSRCRKRVGRALQHSTLVLWLTTLTGHIFTRLSLDILSLAPRNHVQRSRKGTKVP